MRVTVRMTDTARTHTQTNRLSAVEMLGRLYFKRVKKIEHVIHHSPHATPQRQRYLRHPREVLPLSREVARAEADVVRRVLGLDALHVFDLPLTTKGKCLVPVSR